VVLSFLQRQAVNTGRGIADLLLTGDTLPSWGVRCAWQVDTDYALLDALLAISAIKTGNASDL
jgi:hypothetical protein